MYKDIFYQKHLTKEGFLVYTILVFIHRGMEQLAARRAHNPKVVGSSPTPATKKTEAR